MTEFEKADVDGNGSIDQSEWDRMAFEDKRLKMLDDDAQRDAQRKMAWFSLFGMLLYFFSHSSFPLFFHSHHEQYPTTKIKI